MAIRAGHKVTVADFDALGLFALKTADEGVTSSTTMQNDDELVIAVSASAKYILDGYLLYTGAADTGGGLKMGWTAPAGTTLSWTNFGTNQAGTPALVNYNVVAESLAGGRGVATNTTSITMSCRPTGILAVGVTAGNLQLQWAQGTSNATATTVKSGSWLRLVRVA